MNAPTFYQAQHLLTLVKEKGLPAEQLQALFDSGLLADLLDANVEAVDRDLFRKHLGLTPVELRFTLDYSMSLQEMIAAGQYDWVNPDITAKRFPLTGKGTHDLVGKLIHLNRPVSSEEVVAELDKMGLRPATIEELLAFGAAPDLQRNFPVLALGSSCLVDSGRRVACLSRDGAERGLDLYWWSGRWNDDYRFLAVRKPVPDGRHR